MTCEAEVISPEDCIEEAARVQPRVKVGPLPICDDNRLVGMVTDGDIIVRTSAAGKDPRTARCARP